MNFASGVNAGGNVVVGSGRNPNGDFDVFIARVGFSSGLIGVMNMNQSVTGNSGVLDSGSFATFLPLNGAHHRPLLALPGRDENNCAWVNVDTAYFGHDDQDADATLYEIGACHDFIPGRMRGGIGIGKTSINQDLIRRLSRNVKQPRAGAA
jgi:hypothetical protein